MRPTKAVYVDWHLPRRTRGQISLCKKNWEIALIHRTTYFAREYNSLIPVLYCDEETFKYYKLVGLDQCFDEIYPILPMKTDFDSSIFWAAGKFMAMQHVDQSFVMMDLDAEVRFELEFDDSDVFCSHIERIHRDDICYYPSPEYLDTQNFLGEKYGFKWDYKAYNTALIYFKDIQIAKEYAETALEYIRSVNQIDPAFELGYIIMIEQRFLYEFCRSNSLKVSTLITGEYVTVNTRIGEDAYFSESNIDEIGKKGFLHVWGFKTKMHDSVEKSNDLYESLSLSRENLTKQIQDSVAINMDIFEREKLIFS